MRTEGLHRRAVTPRLRAQGAASGVPPPMRQPRQLRGRPLRAVARGCPSINRAALRAFALSNGVVVAYALRVGRRSGASAACCRPFLPPSPPIPDCVGAVLVRTNPHLRARCVWAVIARVVAVN